MEINNKTFEPFLNGVRIVHGEEGVRRFMSSSSFDYNEILGLNKPMGRVKALTGSWSSTQNCHIVRVPKFCV